MEQLTNQTRLSYKNYQNYAKTFDFNRSTTQSVAELNVSQLNVQFAPMGGDKDNL